MADFAPELDDGELYLPSDIFPDDELPSEFTHCNELSDQLPVKGVPGGSTVYSPATNLQLGGFRGRAVSQSLQTGFGFRVMENTRNDLSHARFGNIGFRNPPNPAYFYLQTGKAVQTQARAEVYPRQPNPVHNRSFPGRFAAIGPRDYGGTGVFLPQIINDESRRKPNMRSAEQRQEPMRKAGVIKQGMAFQYPTARGLPPDWPH